MARDQGATPEIIDWQVAFVRELIEVSRTEEDPVAAEAAMRQILDAAAATAPPGALPADPAAAIEEIVANYNRAWMGFFIAYDPATDLRALQIPVLAVFAELDLQASAELNAPATQAALQGNPTPPSSCSTGSTTCSNPRRAHLTNPSMPTRSH
jgi:hypothetical protein